MTFAYPWVLLFLAIPVLLIVVPPARAFGLGMPFDGHAHRRRRLLTWLLMGFDRTAALVLAGVILILADPQTLKRPREQRSLTNIQFCLDVSGSMTIGDKYKNSCDAIKDFLEVREGDAFGLTLFGSNQIRWTPLTKDLSAIRNALPFANPAHMPSHMGGTVIGASLLFCRDNMIKEAEPGDRVIILVSDGESSDLGSGTDFAKELSDAKITLYHIQIGSTDVPRDVMDIANQTGGQAFAARDAAAMKHIFEHIDRMKPAKFQPSGTVPMDHYAPFALATLGVLALRLIGLLGLRHTPW